LREGPSAKAGSGSREVTVNDNASGMIILHFGQLDITEKKTGFTFILDDGYKVTFNADGSVSRPIKAN
jgi:hypothetical protein